MFDIAPFPFFGFDIFDFNPKSKKGTELIKTLNQYKNFWTCYQLVMAMFDYEGLPFRKEFLERLLISYGYAVLGQTEDGKIHVGFFSYTDKDENGIPEGPITLTTLNGESYDLELGKNAVLCFNNELRLPELMIWNYAETFNETDISIKALLKKARLFPIPLAKDSKTKNAINDALGSIDSGNINAISYDGIKSDLLDGGADPVTMMHLTEPEHTDKLQYMSKFYDDQLRRFMTFYGHPLSSASKMAQVTAAELEGYTTYSRIYPEVLLKERQAFIEEANKLFKTDIKVDYSKAWEHLKNDIVLNNEEVTDDDTTEDVETAPDGEQDVDPGNED